MLPIAGQTAGPNMLKILWTLMGGRGQKIQKFFLRGQRRALQLINNKNRD